ncbi:MAG: mannose-1-phosphate guanylyltransferase [Fimbriimonadaceae bacterium]|nr:mannose-1-phosphate guanylyltransferase [Fimbriimonadaceae bacterium]
MKRIAVIMAGGSGERFWPLSRQSHPKQLLKLAHPDKSLLAQSIERIEPIVGLENIIIATAPHLLDPISAALPFLGPSQIQAEPHKRNTAGCLVWTAANILARDPSLRETGSIAVLTADHRIEPDEGFHRTIRAALELAEETGGLVTIGIRPDRPETGYGYIELASDLESRHNVACHSVRAFKEKPDLATAGQFLASGRFLWNSGTFFWRLDAFLAELAIAAPDLFSSIEKIAFQLREKDEIGATATFATLPSISIDYALMERAKKVFVVSADFNWDDVGSWDALDRSLPHDDSGNVAQGSSLLVDTKNSIVMNEHAGLTTCILGVEGLVVAVTGDALLVIPKDRAQEVKTLVDQLKAHRTDLL